jgi:hypothetical protein
MVNAATSLFLPGPGRGFGLASAVRRTSGKAAHMPGAGTCF